MFSDDSIFMLFGLLLIGFMFFPIFLFFTLSMNSKLKRRILPFITVLFTVLIISLFHYRFREWDIPSYIITYIFIILIAVYLKNSFSFCKNCGKTIESGFREKRINCQRCNYRKSK